MRILTSYKVNYMKLGENVRTQEKAGRLESVRFIKRHLYEVIVLVVKVEKIF